MFHSFSDISIFQNSNFRISREKFLNTSIFQTYLDDPLNGQGGEMVILVEGERGRDLKALIFLLMFKVEMLK